jgi:hypothetical protein
VLDNLTRAARQHAANAMNAWRPPKLEVTQNRRMMRLPDATPALDRVRRGGFGDEITRLAENVLDGQYRILGRDFTLTAPLPWRRDLLNGASEASPLAYYQRVPAFEGDLRLSRELNRHQHLVLLAQAWMLSHEARFIDEILRQLADWREANPLNRGVHWTSPLEVALRALSWIWIDHLVGARAACHRGDVSTDAGR